MPRPREEPDTNGRLGYYCAAASTDTLRAPTTDAGGEDAMTSPERTPVPPGASPPTGTSARGDGSPPDATVHHGLKITAAYAWRLIVVAVAVYLVFVALAKLTFVAVAVFVGLVITALLRPLVDLLARWLPRGMAVAVALLLTIVALGGVFTFVADSVAGQSAKLSAQFISGLNDLERSLAGAPLHLRAVDLTQLGQQIRSWVTQNGGSLAGQAIRGGHVPGAGLPGPAPCGV